MTKPTEFEESIIWNLREKLFYMIDILLAAMVYTNPTCNFEGIEMFVKDSRIYYFKQYKSNTTIGFIKAMTEKLKQPEESVYGLSSMYWSLTSIHPLKACIVQEFKYVNKKKLIRTFYDNKENYNIKDEQIYEENESHNQKPIYDLFRGNREQGTGNSASHGLSRGIETRTQFFLR